MTDKNLLFIHTFPLTQWTTHINMTNEIFFFTRIVILAGDVSPVDVICHMPLVCEEEGLPYCYTPSKEV